MTKSKAGRNPENRVQYFPHYVSGVRVERLRKIILNRYNHQGYSCWMQLQERLADAEDHFLECADPLDHEWLLSELRVTPDFFDEFIKFLIRMEVLDRDLWEGHKVLWCQDLVTSLRHVYSKRVNDLPQKPVFDDPKSSKPAISEPEMDFSGSGTGSIKEKEIEENLMEERTPAAPPQLSPAELAKKFFAQWKNPEIRDEIFEKYSMRLGSELDKFCSTWTEPTPSGKKQRWQLEKTWFLPNRIGTWMANKESWNKNGKNKSTVDNMKAAERWANDKSRV